jgi:predicted ester cyclase
VNNNPKSLIEAFLLEVRSGKNPSAAGDYMAPQVTANQVVSEEVMTITRTPQEYAAHVQEMVQEYGAFDFRIDELIAEGNKVYARWTQVGNGITQVTSCVYRIERNQISEYWIQIDRLGLQIQKNRL